MLKVNMVFCRSSVESLVSIAVTSVQKALKDLCLLDKDERASIVFQFCVVKLKAYIVFLRDYPLLMPTRAILKL